MTDLFRRGISEQIALHFTPSNIGWAIGDSPCWTRQSGRLCIHWTGLADDASPTPAALPCPAMQAPSATARNRSMCVRPLSPNRASRRQGMHGRAVSATLVAGPDAARLVYVQERRHDSPTSSPVIGALTLRPPCRDRAAGRHRAYPRTELKVSVHQAGNYEIVIYYTSRPATYLEDTDQLFRSSAIKAMLLGEQLEIDVCGRCSTSLPYEYPPLPPGIRMTFLPFWQRAGVSVPSSPTALPVAAPPPAATEPHSKCRNHSRKDESVDERLQPAPAFGISKNSNFQ